MLYLNNKSPFHLLQKFKYSFLEIIWISFFQTIHMQTLVSSYWEKNVNVINPYNCESLMHYLVFYWMVCIIIIGCIFEHKSFYFLIEPFDRRTHWRPHWFHRDIHGACFCTQAKLIVYQKSKHIKNKRCVQEILNVIKP